MSSPFNEEKYKRLLEGLEISEIYFSELNNEHRIDAEYFSKQNLFFQKKLLDYGIMRIGDIATVTDGIHTSIDYDENSHINLISATSPRDNVFDLSRSAYISEKAHSENPRTALKKNDVIISTVGTIGNCAVVDDSILPANSDRHVGIIRINTDYSPYVLSTFLLSKYGKTQTLRESTGNVQLNLFIYKLRDLYIPRFSETFQQTIEQIVKSAHANLSKSKSLYSEAEKYLLSELGIKGWKPNNKPVNIKQLKESFLASGRLDAEYYQPKYEDYATFIKKYKGGADSLGNICTLNEKNFNPLDSSEYKYIELSNIGNSGEITGCTASIGAELPSRARRLVHTNDVIVSSIEGSLQSVALVTAEYDKALCSTGFYVVKSDTINPETLLVLFKSEPMQNLLKQGCSGTILTAIGRNELQNMVMPKIRKEVQSEIATYVQKSISLRNEAKQLLESAKLKVEDAISTPPHLIDNQLVIEYNKLAEESTYYYRLAEWTLLRELYAEAWVTTSTANYSIKNYSVCKSSGRLDAEYYQPKYDALFAQLSKYECDTIKDIAHIKKSVEPGSEAYQDSGIPFVRVSDVTKFGISEPNIYLSPSDFNLNELRPKKDTILLSKDGSVGIAYKIEEDMDCITSGALLHLSVFNEDYTPDYLTLVLNSIVVQMQAERDSNGAIIQHWKPSEIEQVTIPRLPKPIQETISAKIQASFALKAESKQLLDEAKMMVEREIEKGGK